MRIGIDLSWLLPGMVSGGDTYARGLVAGLDRVGQGHEFVVFTNQGMARLFKHLTHNFRLVVCAIPANVRAVRIAWEQMALPALVRRERLDLLHGPLNVIPIFARCPMVVTIHDLNFKEIPESFSFVKRSLLRLLVTRSAKRADIILTVSEYIRSQIPPVLGVAREKVVAIHSAAQDLTEAKPSWGDLSAKFGLAPGYILALTSASHHKNIVSLLRAFAGERWRHRPQLVLAGKPPSSGAALDAVAHELGVSEAVVFTGPVSSGELAALYENAAVFVFPSLYEGFGIPIVEANRAGTPVVCSNVCSLPEVAGRAALYFDPRSVEDIARKLRTSLESETERRRLKEAGHFNASRFSWERTASNTLNAYERAYALSIAVRDRMTARSVPQP